MTDKTEDDTAAPEKGQQQYIFRPYIRLKDGQILYAAAYGKKAFRIPVDNAGV